MAAAAGPSPAAVRLTPPPPQPGSAGEDDHRGAWGDDLGGGVGFGVAGGVFRGGRVVAAGVRISGG
ncbi:MAG TPA: hypothetical protein DEQ43_18155 [Nocardioides bacterium]|nr:hypothetical protein [Nocardioides sp.]